MTNKRNDNRNSTAGLRRGFVNDENHTPLPEGVTLSGEVEMVLWGQFTRVRRPEEWRDFDLLIIHKIVKAESRMRMYNEMIENSGPVIENKRGTLVENPMLRVVDGLQRLQLAMIRSMSMNQTDGDARDINLRGQDAEAQMRVIRERGPLSLLTMPASPTKKKPKKMRPAVLG